MGGGSSAPDFVGPTSRASADQRQSLFDIPFDVSSNLAETGISSFFGPTQDFVSGVSDPFRQFLQQSQFTDPFGFAAEQTSAFGPLIEPFTDAAFRTSRRQFGEGLDQLDQRLQQQGAFFSGDRPDIIQRAQLGQQETEADFLSKLTLGLGELGVGLGTNLAQLGAQGQQALFQGESGLLSNTLGQQLQGTTTGLEGLAGLRNEQLGLEAEARGLENQRRVAQFQNQGDGFLSNALGIAAPFASLIPGVGPLVSLGLSAASNATSAGGFDVGSFLGQSASSAFIGQQLGGLDFLGGGNTQGLGAQNMFGRGSSNLGSSGFGTGAANLGGRSLIGNSGGGGGGGFPNSFFSGFAGLGGGGF